MLSLSRDFHAVSISSLQDFVDALLLAIQIQGWNVPGIKIMVVDFWPSDLSFKLPEELPEFCCGEKLPNCSCNAKLVIMINEHFF